MKYLKVTNVCNDLIYVQELNSWSIFFNTECQFFNLLFLTQNIVIFNTKKIFSKENVKRVHFAFYVVVSEPNLSNHSTLQSSGFLGVWNERPTI